MPLYEYQCESCSVRFERIQKFSDPLVDTCPSCGGGVRKLLSSPAIQFKGSGWYITDYARKSGGEGRSGKDTDGRSGKDTTDAKDTAKKDTAAGSDASASSAKSTTTPTTKND